MNKPTLIKSLIILAIVIIASYVIYPNIVWYSMPLQERQEQAKRKNPDAQKVIPIGLDLQGGVHLVYQIDLSKLPDLSDQTVTRAVEQNIVVIKNRIDALGVANANVARQGREFILIQLPGVYESEEAKRIIGKTALLEFRMVKDSEALVTILQEMEKKGTKPEDVVAGRIPAEVLKLIPAGMALVPQREGSYLLVNDKPDLTGKYLKEARVEFGGGGGMAMRAGGLSIGFELNAEGAGLFEALTSAHINDRLAIILDGMVQSAPRIESRIPGGRGQITGSFDAQEAKMLANILNSGNLQAPMSVVEERTIGPEMGEDSIRSGMKATLIGFIFVVVFMIFNYRFSGFLANIALVLNLILILAVMNYFKATLTMPGIAGLILSLAMAVDANILILERVREELAKGKQARISVAEGYEKAFSAIVDGNLTTIITAVFLFQFGSGPVRGFALTLIFGLLISMWTAVWVTKVFYEALFDLGFTKSISV